jgi:hypothetical protein
MPMRGEISLRPEPQAAEPFKLSWGSVIELNNDPDFVVTSSFIVFALGTALLFAIRLPLVGMMADLIGQVGFFP